MSTKHDDRSSSGESVSSPSGSVSRPEAVVEPQRAVPLSSRSIIIVITFLTVYSVIYLFYAQYHKVLFYFMTGAIAIWICIIYTYGILAVFYMLIIGYKLVDEGDEPETTSRKAE